mmetsp:Transcript_21456/g.40353  ORF Transcript_21456/g.40353 Transcript_21456/m.40353 type:complete len:225 (-) Transcript_21456:337-1011(-)
MILNDSVRSSFIFSRTFSKSASFASRALSKVDICSRHFVLSLENFSNRILASFRVSNCSSRVFSWSLNLAHSLLSRSSFNSVSLSLSILELSSLTFFLRSSIFSPSSFLSARRSAFSCVNRAVLPSASSLARSRRLTAATFSETAVWSWKIRDFASERLVVRDVVWAWLWFRVEVRVETFIRDSSSLVWSFSSSSLISLFSFSILSPLPLSLSSSSCKCFSCST